MDWTLAALGSTVIFAGVNVVDKRLLAVYFPSVESFNFVLGVVWTITGLVVALAVIATSGTLVGAGAGLALVSGLLWAIGLSFFFFGLRLEDVSRATPIYNTFPLFASLLAVAFLGERLTGAHWVAIVIVVAGTAVISVRRVSGKRGFVQPRALAFLLLGALLTGSALVVNKGALGDASFWTVFGLRGLGMGLGLAVLAYRPTLLADVFIFVRNPQALRLYVWGEMSLALAAVLLQQLALQLGPVSLVSAVMAVRPLVVLAVSAALSTSLWNVLNEPLDRETLALKLAGTSAIAGGLVLLLVT